MCEQCDVVMTYTSQRHEEIHRAIAEGLDQARSLPEVGGSTYSRTGPSSSGDGCVNASGGTRA